MSIWASTGPDISTRVYEHSGHRPRNTDPPGPFIDIAYVPEHLSKGVWVRLAIGELDVVLGRRAVTQLRDILSEILEGPRG